MLTFVLIDRWFFLWFWFWFFHTPLKTALIQLAKCFFLFLKNIPYLNDCRYMWTAVWEMDMRAILAAMNTTQAVVKIRPEKKLGLYEIWTHDLYVTGAVLYLLS